MIPKAVVVCGPTATGKTAVALRLARRLGGEVVSADSMQVYRGLPVGTAAVSPAEADGIPVHLSGFLAPEVPYSVAQWLEDATKIIEDIAARNIVPVVCGGTGLYIQSLVRGIAFTSEQKDEALRKSLEEAYDAEGGAALLAKLAENDPQGAAKLLPNDKKRVVRAFELWLQTGQTAAQRAAHSRGRPPKVYALCIGLNYAVREDLYAAIGRRADAMMAHGLLDEARRVWENQAQYHTARQAIGYKEFFPYFKGEAGLETCVEHLKKSTRNYAKRQLTWFNGMSEVQWLDAQDAMLDEKAAELARRFMR